MKPFEDALRMIRHAKWWEDHTSHLKRYTTSCVTVTVTGRKNVHCSCHFLTTYFDYAMLQFHQKTQV